MGNQRNRITIEVSESTYRFFTDKVPWGIRSRVLNHVLTEVALFMTGDIRTGAALLLSGRVGLESRTACNPDPLTTTTGGTRPDESAPSQSSDFEEAGSRRGEAREARVERKKARRPRYTNKDFFLVGEEEEEGDT